MSKHMEYRKQIETIEEQLTKENKEYMGRVNGYMMITSIFHRKEEAVTAQLLSIYQDVLDAQQDGHSAEEYLGKDSKQMADDLLSYLPPIGFVEVANLSGLMLIIYLGSQWLMDFAGTGTISLNWLGLICDALLSLLLPAGIFLIIRGLIYQTSKIKIWASFLCIPLLFLVICGLRLWVMPKEPDLVLTGWGLVVPLTVLGLALLFFQKEKLVRYVFFPTYLFMIVGGVVNMVMTVPVWLNLLLLLIPAISSWLGVWLLVSKKEK
ncbi:TPA: hypothetical protein U1B09_001663 [Streptococcus suis]|uniref:hypothetical protein n=1 Tax=Streptococcus TaxID=1301 RepID=UPI001961223C|nr:MULTISPECIES: hypothetical protein [Streptococcus]MBM7136607.1 hypothetical protein [Streptococcus suis]MBY0731541.1 hypothetical protein [Streptococcus sp. 2018162]MCO8177617.1 hypothetical protein [Streptococcus suis]HEM3464133.1 hypothetical protein [Streptococcus suis]